MSFPGTVPNPVEHAWVLVHESFSGDVESAVKIADLNIYVYPEKADYWNHVAVACRAWGELLERARA